MRQFDLERSSLMRPGRAVISTMRSAKIDRLHHRVGDEHHGLAMLLPDAQQFMLQMTAGECIERAKRLVHEK